MRCCLEYTRCNSPWFIKIKLILLPQSMSISLVISTKSFHIIPSLFNKLNVLSNRLSTWFSYQELDKSSPKSNNLPAKISADLWFKLAKSTTNFKYVWQRRVPTPPLLRLFPDPSYTSSDDSVSYFFNSATSSDCSSSYSTATTLGFTVESSFNISKTSKIITTNIVYIVSLKLWFGCHTLCQLCHTLCQLWK